MNLWVIFLTGLTVGGLTCLVVQGGLLTSVITAREGETTVNTKQHALFATGVFLIAKLLAYTILGFILGAFGGAINITDNVKIFMQLLAGIYMIAVAFNLLNVHPVFRYAIIQPPRFLTRMVRNQSKSKDIFAPALLGAMTIFIPCGTTLAMEALAISTANALNGALIMTAFILGTIPLFFGIGFVTSILGDAYKTKFLKLAAVAVFYLGITSVNGALVALDSPLSFQAFRENIPLMLGIKNTSSADSDLGVTQNPEIVVTANGYSPNYIRVKKGLPVNLKLIGVDAYSCASAFRIPSLGIRRNLAANETQTVTFTPQTSGRILFSCSMGMYSGVIEVL